MRSRTVRRLALAALLPATLVACEDEQERAVRQDRLCRSYGAEPGTSTYVQCRATIHVAEVMKRRQDDAQAAAVSVAVAAGGAAAPAYRR